MKSSKLKELFEQHNDAVKPAYVVDDINTFENYLLSCSNRDETLVDGVNYVEIASNETLSGNPFVLNWGDADE